MPKKAFIKKNPLITAKTFKDKMQFFAVILVALVGVGGVYLANTKTNLLNFAANDSQAYQINLGSKPTYNQNLRTWKISNIHHLTCKENMGKHNLFVKFIDKNGRRLPNTSRINWSSRSCNNCSTMLDKASYDLGHADIALWANDVYRLDSITVNGNNEQIQQVSNIHTLHPDECIPGNTIGHHSFLIEYTEQQSAGGLTDITPPDINITSPQENSIQSGAVITTEAIIVDNSKVQEVNIFLDNNLIKTILEAPFNATINLSNFVANSTHTIKFTASDPSENISTKTVNFTVGANSNPTPSPSQDVVDNQSIQRGVSVSGLPDCMQYETCFKVKSVQFKRGQTAESLNPNFRFQDRWLYVDVVNKSGKRIYTNRVSGTSGAFNGTVPIEKREDPPYWEPGGSILMAGVTRLIKVGAYKTQSVDNLNLNNLDGGRSTYLVTFEEFNGNNSPVPTSNPTIIPTLVPTIIPTVIPTIYPTAVPTVVPTVYPTTIPTPVPTYSGLPPIDNRGAQIVNPTPYNYISRSKVEFIWNGINNVKNYTLNFGTKVGDKNMGSKETTSATKKIVNIKDLSNIPKSGSNIYVTLVTKFKNGSEVKNYYQYTISY